jgi:hypothetical protein
MSAVELQEIASVDARALFSRQSVSLCEIASALANRVASYRLPEWFIPKDECLQRRLRRYGWTQGKKPIASPATFQCEIRPLAI